MNVYIYAATLYCEDCGRAIKQDIKRELPTEWRDLRDNGDSSEWPCGPHPDGEARPILRNIADLVTNALTPSNGPAEPSPAHSLRTH